MDLTTFINARLDEDEAAATPRTVAVSGGSPAAEVPNCVGVGSGCPTRWQLTPPDDAPSGWWRAADVQAQIRDHAMTHATPEQRRVLAQVEAMRRIVALHQEWPVLIQTEPRMEPERVDLTTVTFRMTQEIQWATNREYVKRFGTEPPTTPILRALATIWRDHPSYDAAWEA